MISLTNGIPDLRQFFRTWDLLHPIPYEQSSIAHLVLPFTYEGVRDPDGVAAAHAFSFLLSFALDWAPDCYSSRHSYFVFKRDPDGTQSAGRSLRSSAVRGEAEDWHVSHVVGGVLIRQGADTYGAKVVLFNRTGQRIFERTYDQPQTYFDLLGTCAADLLSALGGKPSQELRAHLQKPRCAHFESIVDLGRAAYLPERSSEKILQRDPGFAEVRHWLSNQRGWALNDFSHADDQDAVALNDYLFPNPLSSFNPKRCRNQTLAAHYTEWIDTTARLMGDDSVLIAQIRMDQAADGKLALTHALLEAGIETVQRNPACYPLLINAQDLFYFREGRVCDPAMSISIGITTACIPALANSETRDQARFYAGCALADLGFYGSAIALMDDIAQSYVERTSAAEGTTRAVLYADVLLNAGEFQKAALFASLAALRNQSPDVRRLAWVCAGLANQTDLANWLQNGGSLCLLDQTKPNACTVKAFNTPATHATDAEAYDKLLRVRQGAFESSENARVVPYRADWLGMYGAIANAEGDLALNQAVHRSSIYTLFHAKPNSRLLWVFLDAYDRHDPAPYMPAIYEMLGWLHADDPWVVQAVRDATKRHPAVQTPVEQAIQAFSGIRLHPWPIVPADVAHENVSSDLFDRAPPEVLACAVRRMLTQKQYAAASQLCLQAITAATVLQKPALQGLFNHLYHLCRQERPRG